MGTAGEVAGAASRQTREDCDDPGRAWMIASRLVHATDASASMKGGQSFWRLRDIATGREGTAMDSTVSAPALDLASLRGSLHREPGAGRRRSRLRSGARAVWNAMTIAAGRHRALPRVTPTSSTPSASASRRAWPAGGHRPAATMWRSHAVCDGGRCSICR
jgi:hypothetical protein